MKTRESSLSRTPPCPGNRNPESFTRALRLMADSKRSPSWQRRLPRKARTTVGRGQLRQKEGAVDQAPDDGSSDEPQRPLDGLACAHQGHELPSPPFSPHVKGRDVAGKSEDDDEKNPGDAVVQGTDQNGVAEEKGQIDDAGHDLHEIGDLGKRLARPEEIQEKRRR
jgi:hypothetical protein